MSITHISIQDLHKMDGQDGLILRGCGGDPQEWLDGINDLFHQEGILPKGERFKNISVFQSGDLTCILYPFEGIKRLNVEKLAVWRICFQETFGGIWLSDFVDNELSKLQKPEQKKPDCPLIGADGNIFNLMGIAAQTLRQNDQKEQAAQMIQRVRDSHSYHAALGIIGEYVNITSVDDMDEDEGMVME